MSARLNKPTKQKASSCGVTGVHRQTRKKSSERGCNLKCYHLMSPFLLKSSKQYTPDGPATFYISSASAPPPFSSILSNQRTFTLFINRPFAVPPFPAPTSTSKSSQSGFYLHNTSRTLAKEYSALTPSVPAGSTLCKLCFLCLFLPKTMFLLSFLLIKNEGGLSLALVFCVRGCLCVLVPWTPYS